MTETTGSTPLAAVANVSLIVTRVVDRLTGDRADYPLLVAAACAEALKRFAIDAQVMYGQAAWVEILSNQRVAWAGCWGENVSFWVVTQYGEVVDLNSFVAHRKRARVHPEIEVLYAPPLLWSAEVPSFFRFQPEGIAELELSEDSDREQLDRVLSEVREKCGPEKIANASDEKQLQFPNEPILCPGRKLLDDSKQTFRFFDRALAVQALPQAPF